MKKSSQALPYFLSAILLAYILVGGCPKANAQTAVTNTPTAPAQFATGGFSLDALMQNGIQNGGVYTVAGRKLTGNVNLVGVGYIYNMTTSSNGTSAGLLAGYDQLIDKSGKHANIVKGGLNISATIHPLTGFGFPNVVAEPYVAVLIATPTGGTSNNGGIGQITDTGIAIPLHKFSSVTLYLIPSYENRTGEGAEFNGNYGLVGFTVK